MGRPPKQIDVAPTRERLLGASIEVFSELGYSQASVTDIAERAGISGPAVYKHFAGKADLFICAARYSLDHMFSAVPATTPDVYALAKRWLSDAFAPTRRLLLELHLAAGRDAELAELLSTWHHEQARRWQTGNDESVERITAFYLLLLGLAQIDVLVPLGADPSLLRNHVDRMIAALFGTD